MARLLKSSFGTAGTLVNLDGNVGAKGGNERSDVGAVQFALLLLTRGTETPTGPRGGGLAVPGQAAIAVDGIFGPKTAAHIAAYQARRAQQPGTSAGPLPPPDGNFGNFRRTEWNFILLQDDVEDSVGDFIDRVRFDPRCPAFLKESFLT
jgi:hypothetical protein